MITIKVSESNYLRIGKSMPQLLYMYNDNDKEEQNHWNQFFSSWWMLKTLTANQNPSDFNEHLSSRLKTAVHTYNKEGYLVLVWTLM